MKNNCWMKVKRVVYLWTVFLFVLAGVGVYISSNSYADSSNSNHWSGAYWYANGQWEGTVYENESFKAAAWHGDYGTTCTYKIYYNGQNYDSAYIHTTQNKQASDGSIETDTITVKSGYKSISVNFYCPNGGHVYTVGPLTINTRTVSQPPSGGNTQPPSKDTEQKITLNVSSGSVTLNLKA